MCMRFSIITITKNNPNGFQKTKQSVESQTYSNFEWIVVDGEREPDNGIYDAMNKGVTRANGKYIIFMNAGDMFADKNTLCDVAKFEADFIYGDAIEGGFIKRAKPVSKINAGMITHHQAMIYKRDVIGDLQFDETYSLAADYKFTVEFLRLTNSIQYINQPLCIFEMGGMSQKNASESREQEIKIREELKIFSPFTPYRQSLAQVLKKYLPWVYSIIRTIAT